MDVDKKFIRAWQAVWKKDYDEEVSSLLIEMGNLAIRTLEADQRLIQERIERDGREGL